MNQTQRKYLRTELEDIKTKKITDIRAEFVNSRPKCMDIIALVAEGKLKPRESCSDTHISFTTPLLKLVADEEIEKAIACEWAYIKYRQPGMSPVGLAEAIKAGFLMIDDHLYEEMSNYSKGSHNGDFTSSIANYFYGEGLCRDIQDDHMWKAKLDAVKEEHKRIEREVMLGKDDGLADLLIGFSNFEA